LPPHPSRKNKERGEDGHPSVHSIYGPDLYAPIEEESLPVDIE